MSRREFSERLSAARDTKGLSQVQLAAAVEVSSQQVSRWERGASLPQPRLLPLLASTLDLELAEIYELYALASQEDARTARKDRDVLMERLQIFADRYEELGHTYAANHQLLSRLLAQGEAILERLDALEGRIPPPDGEDPPSERTPRRRS